MNKKKIRDSLRLTGAILCFWLYIPHLFLGLCSGYKSAVMSDVDIKLFQIKTKVHRKLALLYFLHNDPYFRTLFYRRIGPAWSLLISWWRPGASTFLIPFSTQIGRSILFAHPFATVLNAHSIGDGLDCRNGITIGKKNGKRPIIGNNVEIGANVCIIGGITIGNNVTIGGGSVVVKDVPDNAIVAGNPAKILRCKQPGMTKTIS